MSGISVGSGTTSTHTMPVKPMAGQALSKVDELNVAVSTEDGDYKVSAEAQYVFEMQKYLFSLDSAEQEKALEFLAQSNEPLQHNVIETFRSAQENRKAFAEGRFRVVDDTELRESQRKLLDTGFVLDGATEIGVRPNGINVFILDGKQNYFPARGTEDNPALTKQLDALEKASSGLLRNRDTANLFGAVSNALNYSEHILLSADDVLHYNYAIEKARKTIEFVNPPAELKAAITDLLERGIAWQNAKQTRVITDSRQLMGNSRVGHHAAEVVRMGTAAQAFNQKLLGLFKSPTVSLLTSDALIKRVIVEQPDLIRFSPTKIDEALAYYRQDDVLYDAALNRGFSLPVEEWKSPTFELDQKLIDASKHYALKMIKEIQGYVSTQQT